MVIEVFAITNPLKTPPVTAVLDCHHLWQNFNILSYEIFRLESNSRRVLEGVVTRVEPFANQVNRIVLDNSRLKQEITWLYRELDFTTQKLMQQQQIINVMASHIGLDELVS